MGYSARVLLDSVSPAGVRLTTLEVTFPRFVLSEFNTHRTFCLDGDTQLYFEDNVRMAVSDVCAQWFTNTRALRAMPLRSCNEQTGEIVTTRVSDVTYSGMQSCYGVTLENGRHIVATKEHRFLTSKGWQTLGDAVGLDDEAAFASRAYRKARFAVNGTTLEKHVMRHFVPVETVEYVGLRETYDLEVEGPHHNFVANGIIVHNSRNSASSRAIPTSKLLERVESDPVLPLEWGRNKPGMSADDVLTAEEEERAKRIWLSARDAAVSHARELVALKVHKQELNRVLEPFLWHTVIVTATEWENFFVLRCGAAAQPEIRAAANRMREAIEQSVPARIEYGQWHLPLVQDDERGLEIEAQKKISAARCARVSYLTHEGKREIEKDVELHDRLKGERHLSPFEHVATPAPDAEFHANFRGWLQMRREIEAATWPSLAVRK